MTQSVAPQNMLKIHGKSFYWASLFLNGHQFHYTQCVYAFCRYVDDIADNANKKNEAKLLLMSIKNDILVRRSDRPIVMNMIELMKELKMAPGALHCLIDGVIRDLNESVVTDESELIRYSYSVASTVGLMMCDVFNVKEKKATLYAIDLGIAMQLTNIARDVIEDAERGRVYLPQVWFDNPLTPKDVLESYGRREEIFSRILRLVELADAYYASAIYGLKYLSPRVRFSIYNAMLIYKEIGQKIKQLDCDEYWETKRVFTGVFEKIYLTIKTAIMFLTLSKGTKHDSCLHEAIQGYI